MYYKQIALYVLQQIALHVLQQIALHVLQQIVLHARCLIQCGCTQLPDPRLLTF